MRTINALKVTFDPAKNERNIRERGLSFERAAEFGFDKAVFWIDARKAYAETRVCALGLLDGRVHSLVFAEAARGIRVISFRKANKREANRYEQEAQP